MDVRITPKIAHASEIVLVGNADVIRNGGEKNYLYRMLEAVEVLGYAYLAVNLSPLGLYSECYGEVVLVKTSFDNGFSRFGEINIYKSFGRREEHYMKYPVRCFHDDICMARGLVHVLERICEPGEFNVVFLFRFF